MKLYFSAISVSIIVQSLLVSSLAARTEPALAAIAAALIGIVVIVTQLEPAQTLGTLLVPPTIVSLASAICLYWLVPNAGSWALIGGIWLLALSLYTFKSTLHPPRENNLALTIGFIVLCTLPLTLSPSIQLTQAHQLATALLLVNPPYYLAELMGYDLLYSPWVYTHIPFSDLRLGSINPLLSTGTFLLLALFGRYLGHHQTKTTLSRTNL